MKKKWNSSIGLFCCCSFDFPPLISTDLLLLLLIFRCGCCSAPKSVIFPRQGVKTFVGVACPILLLDFLLPPLLSFLSVWSSAAWLPWRFRLLCGCLGAPVRYIHKYSQLCLCVDLIKSNAVWQACVSLTDCLNIWQMFSTLPPYAIQQQ